MNRTSLPMGFSGGLRRYAQLAVIATGCVQAGGVASAQTVTWSFAGSGNWNTASNWSPAVVPNSSTADVVIDNNPTLNVVVTLDTSAIVNTLRLDAGDQLLIGTTRRLSALGTVTNNGLLVIGSTGTNTFFQPVGTVTLAGSGVLQLNNAAGALLYDSTNTNAAADHLINSATHTIQGLGVIGFQTSLRITNQGLIQANTAGGVLTLNPNASGLSNTGTLRATNGGILTINGDQNGLLDNSGGLIEAQAGSEVRFSNVRLSGGTLTASGSGVLRTDGTSDSFFTNTKMNGNTVLGTRGDLGISGTITNTGNILFTAGNATSDTLIDVQPAGATLTGGGSITMVDASSITGTTPGGTLTIANQTIEGQGSIGRNSIAIVNQAGNTIRANVAGQTLSFDPGTGGLTNQATIEAVSGAIIQMTGNGGGAFNNAGGVIRAAAGSEVQFTAGAEIVGGTLESVGSGVFRTTSSVNTIFDSLTINGNVTTTSRGDITLRGTIHNIGTVQINPGNATSDTILEIEAAGATLTGGGSILMNGNTSTRISGATGATLTLANQTIRGGGQVGSDQIAIVNQANSVLHADTAGGVLLVDVVNTPGAFANSGLLQATNGGTLRFTDSFTNEGIIHTGPLSLVDVNNTLINGVNGTVRGTGTLEVSATLANNGRIAPGNLTGNSAGTLIANLGGSGTVTFGSSSVLDIDLASASSFDVLTISGRATLNGQLAVRTLNGYLPSAAASFTILTTTNPNQGAPALGTFANAANGATVRAADNRTTFVVNYFSNNQVRLSGFSIVGDFDHDGTLDADDIDQLLRASSGAVPPASALFDVNLDGTVAANPSAAASDSDYWVTYLKGTNFGDANLNGVVNFDDLLVLAKNYNNASNALGWSVGNFDGVGGVNFDDLLLLAKHYGQGTATSASSFASDWALATSLVPEPATLAAIAMLTPLGVCRRSRRRHHGAIGQCR